MKNDDMDTRQSPSVPVTPTGSPRSPQPDGSKRIVSKIDRDSLRVLVRNDSNAELIVRACNSHEDLLAAAKRSLDWLASYPGGTATATYEQMRVAIAKAEGR